MIFEIDNVWLRKFIEVNLEFDFQIGRFRRKTTIGSVRIGSLLGFMRKSGYIEVRIATLRCFEHHLVWFYFNGEFPPEGLEIDHKNRIRSDNHPDNLRLCTRSDNNANMGLHRNNKTGYRGVYFSKEKNRFCAQVTKNGKTRTLGYFNTSLEAAKAVAQVRDELYKEFAYHPNL